VVRSKKQHKRITKPATAESCQRDKLAIHSPAGLKLRLFKVAAVLLAPLTFLLLLELFLRSAGFGYPTSFFLEKEISGRRMLVQNNRFGWRFFGPGYARTPEPFAIAQSAPSDTIRIFVLGESAAYGDPQPDFGLPKMLNAVMSLRYPSTKFEVVNVAMTAINSHTIREIAKDCARADGDIWVLYIGNNEVVGPFGGGTVFGPQVPSRTLVRANLWLKTTRTGQLLDVIRAKLNPSAVKDDAWHGMKMFLDQQVSANDPRMKKVYEHYRSNLDDIIDYGRKAGAGIALCSVAVNLRNCAPFASSTSQQSPMLWQSHYQRGIKLQKEGQWAMAIKAFEDAEMIDDQVAELHFRKGQCALKLDDAETAFFEFGQARDLDTLRFRSDSRMSGIVRDIALEQKDPQIRFVDAESAFAAASSNGIPGREFFYEHVHLTWEGNWLLAVLIADQVEDLLPAVVKDSPDVLPSWPSSEQCAKRLAWTDRERLECLSDVSGRLNDPPFTLQLDHEEQIAYLKSSIALLEHASGPDGLRESLRACKTAIELAPNDPSLLRRLANLQLQSGQYLEAGRTARRVTELLPHDPSTWNLLAASLSRSGQLQEAFKAYEHALRLDAGDVWARYDLAEVYFQAGMTDKAMEQWKRVVALQPKFGTAYLRMGQVLESQGKTLEAEALYRKALANPVKKGPDLALLGKICIKKGWYDLALTVLGDAARLSPTDASIRYDLASVLKAMGREEEASEQLALANRSDPNLWVSTKYNMGIEHGRQGKLKESVEDFREVVRLKPDLMEGHFYLAIGCVGLGLKDEAVVEFNHVLRLDPDNEAALQFLESLGAAASPVDSQ